MYLYPIEYEELSWVSAGNVHKGLPKTSGGKVRALGSTAISYNIDDAIVWKKSHSTRFSGKGHHRSAKASRREDLQVEEPISSGDHSSFHLHATLASMPGSTLIRHQVIQVREPS
jgi:hypothetical protein